MRPDAAARRAWRWPLLAFFALLAAGACLLGTVKGAAGLSLPEVWQALTGEGNGGSAQIVRNIRLPRVLTGAAVGMNLALAGTLLQGVLRNSLADPHIIGVSAGAGLTGILILVMIPQAEALLTPAAFVGAIGAAALVYALAWNGGLRPGRVILAGVAVAALFGAGITSLLIFYSDRVHGALAWMAGGLAARTWPHVYMVWPYALVGGLIAMAMAGRLNLLQLGDDVARSLGLAVEKTRLLLIALAALLAASAVSVAGLLGFVGLIVPHAARLLIGSDHRFLLPAAGLLGAATVTFCDTIARTAFAPLELPVGVLMAALGAPFFLYLLRKEL